MFETTSLTGFDKQQKTPLTYSHFTSHSARLLAVVDNKIKLRTVRAIFYGDKWAYRSRRSNPTASLYPTNVLPLPFLSPEDRGNALEAKKGRDARDGMEKDREVNRAKAKKREESKEEKEEEQEKSEERGIKGKKNVKGRQKTDAAGLSSLFEF